MRDVILIKNTVRRHSPNRIVKKRIRWDHCDSSLLKGKLTRATSYRRLSPTRKTSSEITVISKDDILSSNSNDEQGSLTYSKNISNYWIFRGITFKR